MEPNIQTPRSTAARSTKAVVANQPVSAVVLTGTRIRPPRCRGIFTVKAQLDDNQVLVQARGSEELKVLPLTTDGQRCLLVEKPSDFPMPVPGFVWRREAVSGMAPDFCRGFQHWLPTAPEAEVLAFGRARWQCDSGTPLFTSVMACLTRAKTGEALQADDYSNVNCAPGIVMEWLREMRFGTWAKLQCHQSHIDLVQRSDVGEGPSWLWRFPDGWASETPFNTDTEAALDAVQRFRLD